MNLRRHTKAAALETRRHGAAGFVRIARGADNGDRLRVLQNFV